jgi:hypothetical protein
MARLQFDYLVFNAPWFIRLVYCDLGSRCRSRYNSVFFQAVYPARREVMHLGELN